MRSVNVIGAGPAGSSAALAALAEGASVALYEKARFPRHKVCGEFISSEILPLLESLHMKDAFLAAAPARLTRAIMYDRAHRKHIRFPEPAYGLSRFALDDLLLKEAVRRGAELKIQSRRLEPAETTVVAHGRQIAAPKGGRLFGFKAHFEGPMDDLVELYFFPGGYAGVSPVENGAVNVAGLAPEELLRAHDFHPEALFTEELRSRLRPMQQSFDWLMTGPLVFHSKFEQDTGSYLAGDAQGFVDPFTGSGILAAMLTGSLAGKSAARGTSIALYNQECRRIFGRQYGFSAFMRRALEGGPTGEVLLAFLRIMPAGLLYRLSQPTRGLSVTAP